MKHRFFSNRSFNVLPSKPLFLLKALFLNSLVIASFFFASKFANAHGEDKPGPNGGYIRMPGAYHTELVVSAPHSAKVYLLDFNWKNPVVKDSSVRYSIAGRGKDGGSVDGKPSVASECKAARDHFVCEFSKSVRLSMPGTLTLISTRSKQSGAAAIYTLPLSFKPEPSAAPTKDDHHHHHHHHH